MKLLKFIEKWLGRVETKQLILLFLAWRIWTLIFALVGLILLPLPSPHLLGGGIEKYLSSPLFWGWANFDGEHYLAIAKTGYERLTHSFFPVYPLLIRYLLPNSLSFLTLGGLFISNLAFLTALFIFWKLLRLDLGQKETTLVLLGLITFPTSFFFGAFYTESLFLLLALTAFWAARQQKWLMAGILGAIASATRIYGILLFPAFLVEWWQQKEKKSALPFLFMIPLGLLFYMLFLYQTTGDPFAFYHELFVFGEQRGGGKIVLLPQVFARYIKMIFSVSKSDPIYLTIVLEAAVGVGSFILLVWGYIRKLRWSYLLFAILGYILPSLTGSFSSLPRYVLVLFPLFFLLGIFLSHRGWLFKFFYFLLSFILLGIETAFFIKGYWVG